jgi:uncharacterized RDD family membrane protein YckC
MRKYLLKSATKRAQMTRFVAKGVDLFICLLLSMFYYPFGILLAISYVSFSDSLQDGQSIGKKLMGFKVVSLEDGKPCTMKQSVIRNLPFSVPLFLAIIPLWGWIFSAILSVGFILLELYLLFHLDSGHRLGDVMADTSVVFSTPDAADLRKVKNSWFDQNVTPIN